jgi:RHS repeat-associated protein
VVGRPIHHPRPLLNEEGSHFPSGSANAGAGTSTQYIYFRGGLLAQYWYGEGLWFAHLNGLGSTQQFTDWTGANAKDTLFHPWGQLGPQGSGAYLGEMWAGFNEGNFWATSEWQTDTRRYTPGLGRWYTPDPIGKAAARLDFPQTWNMYAYVRNNPTTLTDPSGEFNLLTPLLEAVTSFVSEALDAGSYLVKDVTRSKPKPAMNQPTLPQDPSGLGKEWKDVTPKGGQNPRIPKRFRGPKGTEIEFDPANPNKSPDIWGGRDHWHEFDPNTGERVGDRLAPGAPVPGPDGQPAPEAAPTPVGDTVKQYAPVAVGAGVAAGIIQTIIEALPVLIPAAL